MGTYIDVHSGMQGITPEQFLKAHEADLKAEGQEGVHFVKAWADPKSGKAFCLVEGPNIEAVRRVHERTGHPADETYEVPIKVE